MTYNYLTLIFLIVAQLSNCHQLSHIWALSHGFVNMKHVTIVCDLERLAIFDIVQHAKETLWFVTDQTKLTERHFQNNGAIICINQSNLDGLAETFQRFSSWSTGHPWIFVGHPLDQLKDLLTIDIDKRIYFFDDVTNQLTEYYTINNRTIDRALGHVMIDSTSGLASFTPTCNNYFLARRSNFEGATLFGLTDFQAPYTVFDNNQLNFEGDQEFISMDNVTRTGIFTDLLAILERHLNFKTAVHVRRDRVWGSLRNTTSQWNGMIG